MLWFFLVLVALPFVEIAVLIKIGSAIGALDALGLLLLVSLVGVAIVWHQGSGALRRIREELAMGRVPAAALVDGALIFVAGVLLIIPGFVTDCFGLLLLVPPVRHLVRSMLQRRFRGRVAVTSGTRRWVPPERPPDPPRPPEPPAIDV